MSLMFRFHSPGFVYRQEGLELSVIQFLSIIAARTGAVKEGSVDFTRYDFSNEANVI